MNGLLAMTENFIIAVTTFPKVKSLLAPLS